ncbi:nitrile hydratase subunit beta [Acinetobacter pseudolwoffii]|uniref:nitrile hydratase subunit beta n=1 Tax=Acinetobacter pseudolwoffii TaxID=2053287 RepID=UPI002468C84C|nr:nitrile hydratase subunit beta [Acinetobacter pseudolwoffii]MDH5821279.1 nitrile hydratase subunit beta [Acinetobacter pseudolwoffii]
MEGIHDLGGLQGFGKVPHKINSESYKPVFHEDWEHLAYSLLFLAADHMQLFSVDELRHSIERMGTRYYFQSPYYDRIIIGTATLMVEYGIITQEELNEKFGKVFELAKPYVTPGRALPVSLDRPPFEVGDRVIVRNDHVAGHIRVPGYVFGKQGVILHRTTEKWPFPDTIGHGDKSAVHQPTYHVEFKVKDLWGDAADDGAVVVDLFEGYLDKV